MSFFAKLSSARSSFGKHHGSSKSTTRIHSWTFSGQQPSRIRLGSSIRLIDHHALSVSFRQQQHRRRFLSPKHGGSRLLAAQSTADVSNAPSYWNDKTNPFVVVRHYAREGVTDEQIKSLFEKHEITSLARLDAVLWVVGPIIRDGEFKILSENASAALKRTVLKTVEMLGSQLIYDNTCVTEASLSRFAAGAVSVHQSGNRDKVRCPNISLVMGPSGSGKTMFALNQLPLLAFPFAQGDKEIFRIHVTAATLIGNKDPSKLNLPALLVDYVQSEVAKKLSPTFGAIVPPSIDLYLFVAIDEASRTDYKHLFSDADKIEELVTALKKVDAYKFEKGVHVAVVGTALETSTSLIDTKRHAVKFRMQPWSPANFHALLRMFKRADEEAVKILVARFPILENLTTNARCASFLEDSIPEITFTNQERWVGYVDVAVGNVARLYIKSNGLAILTKKERRFIVVQEAFKAVDKATRQPNIPFFPNFDHIHEDLRSVALSLLDVHVENSNGLPVLTGESIYSASMTPAIAIVLAELLYQKAIISWDWQDFETTTALGEWKTMITEMQPSEFTSARGIIQLRTPVPSGNAKIRFSLPIVGRSTVVLNGRAASYADVMAPYRLVQAKFSVNKDQIIKLNFEEEMGKMGLVNKPGLRLKQAITSVLYTMWQREEPEIIGVDDGTTERFARLDYSKEARCQHYPYQALLSGYSAAHKTASFTVEKKGKFVSPDDDEARKLSTKRPIKVLEEFTPDRPVIAVFATNAERFAFETKGRPTVMVGKDDVDWQGILKKPLPGYAVGKLRENVNVRFMFY